MAINKSIRFKNNVMSEYKKTTKDDVNFPEFCLFFIKRILGNIEEANLDDKSTLTLTIKTEKFPYCYDAFELIARTFIRKGYKMTIPNFVREKREGGLPDVFQYKWTIKKQINNDDLPF